MSESLACRTLIRLITEYLEGALPEAERRRFEEHLMRCDGCSAYVEQMRKTIAVTGSLRAEDLEPAMREALVGAFRGWRGSA